MKLYLGAVDSLSPQPQVGTSCHPVPMDARTCVESRWNLVEAMFLKVCVCVCVCGCARCYVVNARSVTRSFMLEIEQQPAAALSPSTLPPSTVTLCWWASR